MISDDLVVLYSVPIYTLVIGAEMLYSWRKHLHLYSTKGVLANVYLTLLNMGLDLLVRVACLGILDFFYQYRFTDLSWSPALYWSVLILSEDFMYYWLHRVDHYCRFFWAVHVTHHSSEEFNLTVGFRSSVFQPLYRFVYFIPIALLGYKGIDIVLAYAITQIFGILVHTQAVGKLGVLEYVFVTPSHHRVHHASNVRYLDKNMGMLLIIWDKLFGTFEEETENVKYGLTKNLENPSAVHLVFHEWKGVWRDATQTGLTLKQRLLYIFGPPGWSHDGRTQTSSQLRAALRKNKA
jgi:sterol desaturase/sphingolipid hydroxylase (fatty acid hydroxylase superfamily)